LPGPADIKIQKDLPTGLILNNGKAELKIGLEADPNSATVTYNWYKNNEVIEDVNTNIYTAQEPGYYKAEVISSLNRASKNKFSEICKVTNHPVAPTVTINGDYTVSTPATLSITAKLEDQNVTDGLSDLISDNIIYTWYVRPGADSSQFRKLTNADKGILVSEDFDVNNQTNFINVLDILDNQPVYSYKCEVTNILNEESATGTHDIVFVVSH
jgi:hypothetical protein